jgi:protocatechuate 3,4-dioxygenase alpha subunit
MTAPAPTPGQTVGPFYGYALPYRGNAELVPPGHASATRFTGVVLDGAGAPVPDALIEIWQPDEHGQVIRSPGSLRRDGWTFTGFGRCGTDNEGRYSFTTVLPGPLAPGRVPFFAITVFARGLLDRLFTRAYVPVADGELATDPLLTALPAGRRGTLIARREGAQLVFDIRLQGAGETVFLHFPAEAG